MCYNPPPLWPLRLNSPLIRLAVIALDNKTILVVDDSADAREVLRRTLALAGYRVIEATDGREAVEIVGRECPDLILMDLNMPVMDGFAATERIRELRDRCGEVPIVAVTAFDTYGMKDAAREVGCDAYLVKPVAVDEVEGVVAGLLFA
jgi:two-component system, cell cycle response regulator DivK